MKENILNLLTTKFLGVDEKILGIVADKLAKDVNTEEEATKAVEDYDFQKLLSYYGDSRATDAQKTAVANYERKHNLKDGKSIIPNPEPEPEPKPEPGILPDWAKAIVESNKALQDKLNAMEGEKKVADRRATITKAISKLPESMRRVYDHLDVGAMSDEDFTAYQETVSKDVEAISKDIKTNNAVFGVPTSHFNSQSDDVDPRVLAVIQGKEGGEDKQPF